MKPVGDGRGEVVRKNWGIGDKRVTLTQAVHKNRRTVSGSGSPGTFIDLDVFERTLNEIWGLK